MSIIRIIFPEESQETESMIKPPPVTRRSNSQLFDLHIQIMNKVHGDIDEFKKAERQGK